MGQPDRRGGLALPERSRRDRGDDDVAGAVRVAIACPISPLTTGVQCPQVDLGHVAAVGDDVLGGDPRRGSQGIEVNRGLKATIGRNHLGHEASLVGRREEPHALGSLTYGTVSPLCSSARASSMARIVTSRL